MIFVVRLVVIWIRLKIYLMVRFDCWVGYSSDDLIVIHCVLIGGNMDWVDKDVFNGAVIDVYDLGMLIFVYINRVIKNNVVEYNYKNLSIF